MSLSSSSHLKGRASARGRRSKSPKPFKKSSKPLSDRKKLSPHSLAPSSNMDTHLNNDEDGHWKLYEAYNELHGLAQEFSTPFDAPAVLVVGHQTDGKSALVEALMGFQFNHVGGGTKTRRPITLHMKFNPDCHTPLCHLLSESDPSIPQDKSLQEIQVLFRNPKSIMS